MTYYIRYITLSNLNIRSTGIILGFLHNHYKKCMKKLADMNNPQDLNTADQIDQNLATFAKRKLSFDDIIEAKRIKS